MVGGGELWMRETIINSFNEYVEYTEKYKNRFLFRGQAVYGNLKIQ